MAHISQLFSLVKSLTKSEKRYFKMHTRFQEGNKVFMSLFEIIDRDKPVAEDVKRKLKKKFPEAVFEPASKHLYKALMRSLKSFDGEKSIENKLMNLI